MKPFSSRINDTRLPFRSEYHLPDGELTGTLQIRFYSALYGLERMPSCEGATRMFTEAVKMQMFTLGDHRAAMSATSRQVDKNGSLLDLKFRVEALPSSAIDNYIALVAHLNLAKEPLTRLDVSLDGYDGGKASGEVYKADSSRSTVRRPRTSFLLIEPSDYFWGEPVDLWLEFATKLKPEDVQTIDNIMATWGYCVAMGVFDLQLQDFEFIPEFGTTSHILPNTVRYSKEHFDAPAEAIDYAVNCVGYFQTFGLNVQSLRIEQ